MNLVLIGATGATGKAILKRLICANLANTQLYVITRCPLNIENPTVHNIVLPNFDELGSVELPTDIAAGINALGTTRGKSGVSGFRKVDLDYVLSFAKLLKQSHCQRLYTISASNANSNSWFLYPAVKGQCEEELIKLGFEGLYIFRPALLIASRQESRPLETIAQTIARVGDVNSTFSVSVDQLAEAVFHLVSKPSSSSNVVIVAQSDIIKLAKSTTTQ